LFYIVVMIVVSALIEGLGRQLPWFNGEQGLISMFEWFGLDDRRDYGLMLALVAVITPLVEEWVYRTFLTDMFNRHGEIFWVIAWAVIFALSHMEADVFVNLFILWLILWYIYTKTKSWWYPFFFHLIINSMSLLFIFLA
jgi:membrane protease YdiL (CAAX protease family)